jgi:hypothetical protein
VYKFNYINLAFTIGTIFNILVILDDKKNPSENNINYKMIAGMYQFILVMQLFDFVVWNDMQCKSGGKSSTKGAFVATVLQPVFIIILFLLFTQETDITKKLFAFVCLLVYL